MLALWRWNSTLRALGYHNGVQFLFYTVVQQNHFLHPTAAASSGRYPKVLFTLLEESATHSQDAAVVDL